MAYTPLTEEGKKFICKICEGTGNSKLRGKNKYTLSYASPAVSPDKIWISNAKYNGKLLTTNAQLAEALIDWYNKYGNIYQMDSNILAAQAYAESKYTIWTYAPSPSTAGGISQFLTGTAFEIMISENGGKGSYVKFTPTEVAIMTAGINGDKNDIDSYVVSTTLGKQNRARFHQNVIDNPDLMIKAQFRYMKMIANNHNSLASNVLFGYNRGPGYIKSNYTDSIKTAAQHATNYENEGVGYVFRIFHILGDKDNKAANYKPTGYYFGYTHLKMDLPPAKQREVFDNYGADVKQSENL
jgi:hypothetical protein